MSPRIILPVLLAAGFFSGCTSADPSALPEEWPTLSKRDPPAGVVAIEPMASGRAAHTATALDNGDVLIAGGFDASEDVLGSAELYSVLDRSFAMAGEMAAPRQSHTATLLSDGRVLLAGGWGTDGVLASSEIYDPVAGTFTSTGSMSQRRAGHEAVRLLDGRVLVTGGVGPGYSFLDNAEIFDPVAERFDRSGRMNLRRHKHDAVALADGRVLIVGGASADDDPSWFLRAEVFHPRTDRFVWSGTMRSSRYEFRGTSVLLGDGRVPVTGGAGTPEIFRPRRDDFVQVAGGLGREPLFAAAASLSGEAVLLTGGYATTGSVTDEAWIVLPRGR